MFDTLKRLLDFHGPDSKAIVWAHNSHVGDSQATEMSLRGEYNIGRLCRKEFGNAAYSIGFGTNSGTVAAASNWDEPMEIKTVRPALPESYERLCHETGRPQFLLPLRSPIAAAVNEQLMKPRLERAIGVIYRPETELQSHYFQAVLPQQFDEYIWFDETMAVAAAEDRGDRGPSGHLSIRPLTRGHGRRCAVRDDQAGLDARRVSGVVIDDCEKDSNTQRGRSRSPRP